MVPVSRPHWLQRILAEGRPSVRPDASRPAYLQQILDRPRPQSFVARIEQERTQKASNDADVRYRARELSREAPGRGA